MKFGLNIYSSTVG